MSPFNLRGLVALVALAAAVAHADGNWRQDSGAAGWPSSPALNGDCTLNTGTGAISCGLADIVTPTLYGIAYWSAVSGNGTLANTQITGLVKGGGSGAAPTAAVAGTDYLAPPSGTAILKANSGGALANAAAATDYVAPGAITASGLTGSAQYKFPCRYSSGSGALQECTLSTGLSTDGSGNVTASAGGSGGVTLVGKQPLTYSTANSTAEIVVFSQAVGALTANDMLRLRGHVSVTGSTNVKTVKVYLTTAGAGAQGATYSCVGTCTALLNQVMTTAAQTSAIFTLVTSNQNATNSQETSGQFLTANGSVGSVASGTSAIQTSTSSVVVITITKALGTETAAIHGVTLEKISDGT